MTSWLTSALQTVREKSADALDFVRRDLNEFTSTVKTDTEAYINHIRTQEGDGLGINQFVSKFSNPTNKTDNENEKQFQSSASFDRAQKELSRLQNDESIYLTDPTPLEAYENWRQTTDFNVDNRKGEIAQLLIDAPHVRSIYAQLVPAQTTHSDFWSRYYFRVHQLEGEEARRVQLLRRAHEICSTTAKNAENAENDWDELDEDGSQEPPKPIEEVPAPPPPAPAPAPPSSSEPAPAEQHEEESGTIDIISDKTNSERTESDTGDSWEREFDENDVPTSKPDPDPLTRSEDTITSESLSTSTVTPAAAAAAAPSSSTEKKPPNEFDDEWESWS